MQLATPRATVHRHGVRDLAALVSRVDTGGGHRVVTGVAVAIVTATIGAEAALDDPFREARTFYLTYGIITLVGTVIVLTPDIPLVTILVGTQVLNAVLLVPLLVAMVGLGRDRDLMGSYATGRAGTAVYGFTTAVVVICVITLGVTAIT